MSGRLSALSLVLLASCTGSVPVGGREQALPPPPPFPIPHPCDPSGCGTNTAHVGEVFFHELNLDGVPNGEGVVLDWNQTKWNGKPAKLDIERANPFATVLGSNERHEQWALKGLTLHLHTPKHGYTLRVEEYVPQSYWIEWDADDVPAFFFRVYPEDGGDPVPLCTGSTPGVDGVDGVAVIFTGDRYDRAAKTVSLADTYRWFNVGCMGSAIAKMHLDRHTTASVDLDGGHSTTREQRQTLLKLITADYCGNGTAYTTDGMPLRLHVNQPWSNYQVPYAPPFDSPEAVWNEHGAYCIAVPRWARASGMTALDYRDGIIEECGAAGHIVIPCPPGSAGDLADDYLDWDATAYAISANPSVP